MTNWLFKGGSKQVLDKKTIKAKEKFNRIFKMNKEILFEMVRVLLRDGH